MAAVNFNTAQNMITRTARSFSLLDLIKSKDIKHKNLFEMISMYPSRGVGFKIRKIDWPTEKYFVLTNVNLKSNRIGKVHGVLYDNNKKTNDLPVLIEDATTRGMWVYEIADSECYLDNGLYYTAAQMIDFWKTETFRINQRVVDLEKDTREYLNDLEKKKLRMDI